MPIRDYFTTEHLKNMSLSSFELINLIIKMSRFQMHQGQTVTLELILDSIEKKGIQNYVNEIQEHSNIKEPHE